MINCVCTALNDLLFPIPLEHTQSLHQRGEQYKGVIVKENKLFIVLELLFLCKFIVVVFLIIIFFRYLR